MPFDLMTFAVYSLALAAVTGLVTGADTLTEGLNGWAVGRIDAVEAWAIGFFDDRPGTMGWFVIRLTMATCWFVSKMITCMWCASFWLALLMLWMWPYSDTPTAMFVMTALAMRQVVGMTSKMGR